MRLGALTLTLVAEGARSGTLNSVVDGSGEAVTRANSIRETLAADKVWNSNILGIRDREATALGTGASHFHAPYAAARHGRTDDVSSIIRLVCGRSSEAYGAAP